MQVAVIILAAGKGKRMHSELPKVLHRILGRSMLSYVLDAASELKTFRTVVVTGHGSSQVKEQLNGKGLRFAYQGEQLGTGHAVLCARKLLGNYHGDVLIINGDTPLIRKETINDFTTRHKDSKSVLSILSTVLDEPEGYGRISRSSRGDIKKVVEEKDATAKEKQISEINAGVYCVDSAFLWNALENLNPNNVQHEYYLPDIVDFAINSGENVNAVITRHSDEVLGVNTRAELAAVEAKLRNRKNNRLMDGGVTIIDPSSTYITPDVRIGVDTVIYPNAYILGDCSIGWGCEIGPSVWIEDSVIGHNVLIRFNCHIVKASISNYVSVGPFANLRPETVVHSKAKIGSFVEIKKSNIGHGSKVPHLSYVGDASVGEGVNIGAGTITCNYDGFSKHKTVIDDNAFIGSDTMLVAPVRVGKGATTGAGSTITKDVPEGSLAVERSKQVEIKGWSRKPKKSKA